MLNEKLVEQQPLVYDANDFEPSMAYALIDEVMHEDWDDPKMAKYDRYEDYQDLRGASDVLDHEVTPDYKP